MFRNRATLDPLGNWRRVSLIMALVWAPSPTSWLLAQPAEPPSLPALDDVGLPEPLQPLESRGESVEDRMHASALFAEGRLLFRREQYVRALGCYERAFRYANRPTTILNEIIPLAYELGRPDEAARYLRVARSPADVDPFVLRRLALHLVEQEDFDLALRLYQWAARPGDADTEALPSVITQFEIGRLFYLTDRFTEAIVPLGHVREILAQAQPPAAEQAGVGALLEQREVTFALMAECYLRSDHPQEAEALFRSAYQDQPDAPILQFHLARVAAGQQRHEQALQHLRDYLRSGDTEAGTAPYELLASLLDKTDQSDKLLAELLKLAQQQPKNAFLAYYLGEQYLRRREPARAVEEFQRLMQIRPLIDAYRGLIRARLQQRDNEAVLRLLADAVVQLGGFESLKAVVDEIVADPSRTPELVETARQKFFADASTPPQPLQRAVALVLAELLARAGNQAAADEFYQRAAGEGDQTDTAVSLAWGLQRLVAGEARRAVEVFERILPRLEDPRQRAPVNFYLAAALALDDRFDQALEAARQAARHSPELPAIQLRPAWVLLLAKRWPEAATAYQQFLDRFADRHDSAELRDAVREAKISLSSVCVALEQQTQAEEWLEQVLDEFPDDVGAHNDLGYLWADRGVHLERALRMTQYASQAEPDNVAYRDSYGWALYKLGRFQEAVTQLRQATQTDTPDGLILEHLGDALSEAEGPAAALETWRHALQMLGNDEPDRRAAIERKIEQAAKR